MMKDGTRDDFKKYQVFWMWETPWLNSNGKNFLRLVISLFGRNHVCEEIMYLFEIGPLNQIGKLIKIDVFLGSMFSLRLVFNTEFFQADKTFTIQCFNNSR